MSRLGVGGQVKCVQPVGPSYAAPSTVTDRCTRLRPRSARRPRRWRVKPSGRAVSGRERGHDRVVVAAAEDELHRVDAQRGADRLHRLGELERVRGGCRWPRPESCGDVADVGEQPVGDVDHRGRAGPGGGQAGGVRRLRDAGRPRPARGVSGTPVPARPAPPRPSPAVPASATTSPACAPLRRTGRHLAGAQHGHRDDDLGRGGQVTTDDARPDQRRLLGDAVGEVERPLHRAGPRARRARP